MTLQIRKAIILIIIIYFMFITICLIALGSHYVSMGECAAITYYYPLTWWERAGIVLFGIIAIIISLRLISKDMKNRKLMLTIISLIYMLSVELYVIFGNKILGTREIDWPHHYKVQPITSIIADKNIASNSYVCLNICNFALDSYRNSDLE